MRRCLSAMSQCCLQSSLNQHYCCSCNLSSFIHLLNLFSLFYNALFKSLFCMHCNCSIVKRKKIKKIQKKFIEQIFQKITNMSTVQRNLIMFLCKLESKDIILHAVSSEIQANLKRSQTWVKEIMNSTCIMHWIFAMLAYEIHIIINT